MVVGNRDPVSANELALELVGLSAVIAAPSAGLGEAVDDLIDGVTPARLGGRYDELDAQGGLYEKHHMPADSVNDLSRGKGPCILMDPADHRKTASWGRGRAAQQYRALQRQLIEQGRFDDATMMDIDNIRGLFGNKYDEHILQMIDSLD